MISEVMLVYSASAEVVLLQAGAVGWVEISLCQSALMLLCLRCQSFNAESTYE